MAPPGYLSLGYGAGALTGQSTTDRSMKRGIPRIPHPSYFLTRAAMQLISTKEFPGSAATATVVRAGPPFGK